MKTPPFKSIALSITLIFIIFVVIALISILFQYQLIKYTIVQNCSQLAQPCHISQLESQLAYQTTVALLIPLLTGAVIILYLKHILLKPITRHLSDYLVSQNLHNSTITTSIRNKQISPQSDSLVERNKILEQQSEELKIQQALLITSIDSLHGGIAMTDQNGKLVQINKVLLKILDCKTQSKAQEILDQWIEFKHKAQHVTQTSQTVGPNILERDGLYYHVVTTPIKTNEDSTSVLGTVTLIEDISQRVHMDQLKDEFFAMASHELRTPLTAIRGNALVLDQLYCPQINDENFTHIVKDISKASSRLIKMVNAFLDMSRLESGRITLTYTKFNVVDYTKQTITELKELANEKKLYLRFRTKDKTLKIHADRDRIKQILVNLIANSIKFTHQGGITVSVNQITKDEVEYIKFSVKDTGIGISKKDQQKLFNKYEQGHKKTSVTDKGSGLGLYISKLLVQEMGGEIKIESTKVGKGTKMSVTLPAQ